MNETLFISCHQLVRSKLLNDGLEKTIQDLAIQFFPFYENAHRRKDRLRAKQIEKLSHRLYFFDQQGYLVSSCVSISLTCLILLYAEGIEADLVIGIKKLDGKLYSHAWVELKNGRIIDPQKQKKFHVLKRYRLREIVERWVNNE